ncbi:MAG: GatB/YqeY domain-containing protein [Desulfovibrionales bacterium]
MSLSARIERDFLEAYKAKESERVAVLRMLKAAIKNKQVELKRSPDDDEILELVRKGVKQRQESAELFHQAGRTELAEQEEREQALLSAYLPPAIPPQELENIIDTTIAELDAQGQKDMGRVMQFIMDRYKGRVDGKDVSARVRSRLSS